MAEFGMRNQAGAAGSTGGGGVEWYSSSASSYGAAYAGAPQAYGSNSQQYAGTSYEDEPPLLEELGIDIGAIFSKTRAVLFFRLAARSLDDLDMGGALMYIFILAGLHLLMGKLHFGVILGWSVVMSVIMWFLLKQLAGAEGAEAKGLDLYNCCCVVGYCMIPIVVFNAVALLIPKGLIAVAVALACTAWSALTASRIFARRCPALEDLKGVIMCPCLLTYGTFALLSLYK